MFIRFFSLSYLPLETNLYYGLLLYVLLQSLFLHSFHLISCNKSARIFHCKCCIWRQSSFSFFPNAASPARWCCPELSYSLTLPRLLCYSWFAAIAFKSSNTEKCIVLVFCFFYYFSSVSVFFLAARGVFMSFRDKLRFMWCFSFVEYWTYVVDRGNNRQNLDLKKI